VERAILEQKKAQTNGAPDLGPMNTRSLGYRFVLIATNYFTKWSEVVALKNMTHKEVIEFVTSERELGLHLVPK
jgi:hypothetical protein